MAASAAAEKLEDSGESEDKHTPTPESPTMTSMTSVWPIEALKIFIPTPYNGISARDADWFIAQCDIWFKRGKITNTNDKIGEVLLLLKGQAMTWATPHLVEWAADKLPFTLWNKFVAVFKAHFGNINNQVKAIGKLGRLGHQGRNNQSGSDYAIEFENISLHILLSPINLHARFKEGLPNQIKNAFTLTCWGKVSVEALKNATFTINQELRELDKNELH